MHKKYSIHITLEAAEDLLALFHYIQNESQQNAAHVAEHLISAIDSLESFPHRYKAYRLSKRLNKTVRAMSLPPFIIYYRILETHRMIEVVTIRHGAQRQPKKFK